MFNITHYTRTGSVWTTPVSADNAAAAINLSGIPVRDIIRVWKGE